MPDWWLSFWSMIFDVAGNAGTAFLGLGILGALVAYVLRAWSERSQRKKELHGLLRLLATEIGRNTSDLEDFEKTPSLITKPHSLSILRTKAWEDVRVRLSQLLEDERQFTDLNGYYESVQLIREVRLNPAIGDEAHRQEQVYSLLPHMRERSALVKEHIRKYLTEDTRFAGSELTTAPKTGQFPRRTLPAETEAPEEWTREIRLPMPDETREQMFREAKRVLFIERMGPMPSSEFLTRALRIDRDDEYFRLTKDWRVVSHTFDLQADGTVLVTYLLENERLSSDL